MSTGQGVQPQPGDWMWPVCARLCRRPHATISLHGDGCSLDFTKRKPAPSHVLRNTQPEKGLPGEGTWLCPPPRQTASCTARAHPGALPNPTFRKPEDPASGSASRGGCSPAQARQKCLVAGGRPHPWAVSQLRHPSLKNTPLTKPFLLEDIRMRKKNSNH